MATVLGALLLAPSASPDTGDERGSLPGGTMLAGWIEAVRLGASDLDVQAKLDTGADTCSLSIVRLREFRRGGDRWVRFAVRDPDPDEKRRVVFERRLVRRVRIKQHTGNSDLRPVVHMKLCLGSLVREVEVNLVDRSQFDYPLLLGRNFLEGSFVVDSGQENLWDLSCENGEERLAG